MFSGLKQPGVAGGNGGLSGISPYVRPRLSFWPRPRLSRAAFRTCAILAVLALWLLYVYSSNGYNNINNSPSPSSSSMVRLTGSSMARRQSNGYANPYGMDINGIGGSDCGYPEVDKANVSRRGEYIVLNNLIRRNRCFEYNESITLTTHATHDLLDNLPFLSHRWRGPLSVSIYSPGTDLQVAVEYALWLRQCDQNVADFVTFHFVLPEYPEAMQATITTLSSSSSSNKTDEVSTDGALNVTGVIKFDYATVLSDISMSPCTRQCNVTNYNNQLPTSYRTRYGLPYPINVCRNVARFNARTHFVLASDIELYPNANVIARFMVFAHSAGLFGNGTKWSSSHNNSTNSTHRIYVLPIFEVDKSVPETPPSKAILLDLYRRKKAVYFHKYVCSYCNIIPKLNQWLLLKSPPRLGTFLVVKRHKPYHRWEPIYIGTNDDPFYDERLTWEGQQDKMTQMYELCLMDYDVALLDDAFLVHRPGIKRKVPAEYKRKAAYIKRNNRIYVKAVRELEALHGKEPRCK